MSELLKEAFKELETLKEDTFSFDKEGVFNLDRFLHLDDVAPDIITVIDPNADSEEGLKSNYEGQAILKCCVCNQLIYKDPEEVVLDDEKQRANVEEECPHCGCLGGYEVIGQVAPFVDTETTKVEVDGQPVEIEVKEETPLTEDLDHKSIANYFKDVEEGEGWVTLEKAAEDLGRDKDDVAEWINDHETVGYILTFEDIEVIFTPSAPSYDEVMKELGFDEDETLTEGFQKATIETGDSTLSMETDEDGKVTVISEPRKPEDPTEEMIVPVSNEIAAEIDPESAEQPEEDSTEEPSEEVAEEETIELPAADEFPEESDDVDFDIDEIDEDSFNELGESYFHKVYDNVDSFQTIGGSVDGDKILLEGIITFNSGKQARTKFLFESYAVGKTGRLKFIGENAQISKRKNAFAIQGRIENKKLITESLTYNYRALDTKTGKGYTLYGTVKNK